MGVSPGFRPAARVAPGWNRNQHRHVAARFDPHSQPQRSDLRRISASNAPPRPSQSLWACHPNHQKICTVPCGSTTMHPMVTAPICAYSRNNITRAQSRAGEWTASYDFDVEGITPATLPNFASTNESLADSSLPQCNSTGAFCCNHQYSITAITTSAGAISERYAYTAYGQPTILNASGTVISATTLSNRYSYTGREWDATLGLHHFRARWMSPSAGRFLGRDPIGYVGSPDDLYEFLESRTLFFTDPLGKIGIPPPTICCGGVNIYIGPGAIHGCCGNKVYSVRTQCCDATGPLIHTKRNQAQCCADAKAAGLDILGGVPSGGGVICCDGKEVSCSWQPTFTDPQSTQFIEECTLKHEDDHHDSVPCSSQCPGLTREDFYPYWPWRWEECHAYRIEWHCLKAKQSQCSTIQCRIDIDARMSQILVLAHAKYGGCDVTSSL